MQVTRGCCFVQPLAFNLINAKAMANSEEVGCKSEVLAPEKFAEKMINVMDNTALSMAIGIGSTLGLFSVMAGLDEPERSDVIAKKADLVERFVFLMLIIIASDHLCTKLQLLCIYMYLILDDMA